MTGTPFKAIAAMAQNRVIGCGSDIPWHLPEDFKWFKQTTLGNILAMGRKTFESIGRPLPGRTTYVLSRSPISIEGVHCIDSLDNIPLNNDGRDVFICGGGEIYCQALPYCSDLFLTHVKRSVQGDIYFPEFVDQFRECEIIRETEDFRIVHYRNRSFQEKTFSVPSGCVL
ncbi:MAG TPA: dihydrofolate reductase [Verrucomicrobiales bacterium]|nr:dihydrofolate reductase [Verrucomicrobiales bacterium]HIL71659.1 dihydrofolate reductase [Verrucomicrobiota bacterium]